MGKLMIVNGSPRPAGSNSKLYSDIFLKYYKGETVEYFARKKECYDALISAMTTCSDVLFVLPLYTDGLPVCMLELFKKIDLSDIEAKPQVHIMINCGFYEPEQNNVAVDIICHFCKQQGMSVGSVLKIGSGEGFPSTPLMFYLRRTIKKFAKTVNSTEPKELMVTMPISAKSFVKAANKFWIKRAAKLGVEESRLSERVK